MTRASYRMKFSFNIFFLGWWLTGQWQLSRGQYSKPSISVRPSNTVPFGEAFTISCTCEANIEVQFYLYRGQPPRHLRGPQKAKRFASFHFTNANQLNGDIYQCIYCLSPSWAGCSPPSDEAKITVRGQLYPKPSISVSPTNMITLGGDANIHCKNGKFLQAEFYLLKKEASSEFHRHIVKTAQREAIFPFTRVDKPNGALYRCHYCIKSNFYELCSEYSDQVCINIKDPHLPKPSIQMKPRESITPGQNITIECQGPRRDLNFSLYNASDLVASQITVPDKNSTEFPFFMVDFENTGNYTCQYHFKEYPFVWSEPSDPIELLVREDTLPESMALIWVSTTSGLVLLSLLLLLLICLLYQKRKKGSIADEGNEPVDPSQNVYTEVAYIEDTDGITYAELNHDSFKTKQENNPDEVPKSCVYASVALHKAHKN